MRIISLFVVLCAAWSTPAAAQPLRLDLNIDIVADAAALVQRLRPALPALSDVVDVDVDTVDTVSSSSIVLPIAAHVAAYEAPQLPSRYAWVERDTRAFWYAAGAGAVTTIGSHLLLGTPALAIATGLSLSAGSFGVAVIALAGYVAVESLLSGLVAHLVFDSMAQSYRSNFITGVLAHAGGTMLSTTVVSLIGGLGWLVFHGTGLVAPFTGAAGISGLSILTLLGALPAVVVAGTALIAVPSLVTAWALAASAQPREGFAIDPNWQALDQRTEDPTRRPADRVATISVPISLP